MWLLFDGMPQAIAVCGCADQMAVRATSLFKPASTGPMPQVCLQHRLSNIRRKPLVRPPVGAFASARCEHAVPRRSLDDQRGGAQAYELVLHAGASDERMMQLMRAMNRLLDKHPESRRRNLAWHTPVIVPIFPQVSYDHTIVA